MAENSALKSSTPITVRFVIWALILPILVMGLFQLVVPYTSELASHVVDADRIWRGKIDCAAVYRLPIGYAAYISPFVELFGEATGVKIANLIAFAMLPAAALVVIGRGEAALGQSEGYSTRGTAILLISALCLYPYIVLNIARANEAILAAAAVIVMLCLFLRPASALSALVVGAVIGVSIHVRPNMASMLLPAAIWIWARTTGGIRSRARLAVCGLAATVLAYLAFGAAVTGCFPYAPTNGGYNLYAGNNPFSEPAYGRLQNGEPSLPFALQAVGLSGVDPLTVPEQTYFRLTREYVSECPICVATLGALKAQLFFAPRLANAAGGEIPIQWALALLTLAALLISVGKFVRGRRYVDGLVLATILSYSVPFILTNADPRMRFPIDVLALFYVALTLGAFASTRISLAAK